MFSTEVAEGPLLLADISGYTGFLQDVAGAHRDAIVTGAEPPRGYAMMSNLLDGIVGKIVPPFTLAKLEGDAVFAIGRYAGDIPRGRQLLACLRDCYADFRARLGAADEVWTCTCNACSRADSLDLKFVLHAGPYILQSIAGSREVTGSDVVMAHRLLKNGAAQRLGHGAYALLTAAAAGALEVPADGAIALTETIEHYAPVEVLVYPLR